MENQDMFQQNQISIKIQKVYDTEHLSKHQNFYNDMESFDMKTVQFIQKLHFHRNVLKFFLGCIPIFDVKNSDMKTNVDCQVTD